MPDLGKEAVPSLSPAPPHVFALVFSWSLEKATSVVRFKLEDIFPDPEQLGTEQLNNLPFARTWVNPNKKNKKKYVPVWSCDQGF